PLTVGEDRDLLDPGLLFNQAAEVLKVKTGEHGTGHDEAEPSAGTKHLDPCMQEHPIGVRMAIDGSRKGLAQLCRHPSKLSVRGVADHKVEHAGKRQIRIAETRESSLSNLAGQTFQSIPLMDRQGLRQGSGMGCQPSQERRRKEHIQIEAGVKAGNRIYVDPDEASLDL